MRALIRLFLLVGLIAFLVHALRRALGAGREAKAGGQRPARGGGGGGGSGVGGSTGSQPPERLVCGACGQEFDPELSGWICPKCGK